MADSIARQNGNIDIALEPLGVNWRNIFSRLDLDNDGKIDVNEFIDLLKRDAGHGIPPQLIHHLTRTIKHGGAQYITYNEFISLINDRKPKNAFQRVFLQYIRSTVPPRVSRVSDTIDGEYEDEYTCDPPAVCMLLVSIIEISLFIYDSGSGAINSLSSPVASMLLYNPHRRIEVWRFFTYMFVHVGPFHLVVNIIVQIMLGVPLEMVHGWWRVLIVYLSGVLAGSLGTSVSDPTVYLAGASGGVYALITAHVATIILNWSEMRFALWQLLIFVLLFLTDIGTAIYNRYIEAADDKVGYAAHLAGALAGLLVGLYILRNLEVHSWEKNVSRAACVVYFCLLIAIILFNIFYPSYFVQQYT